MTEVPNFTDQPTQEQNPSRNHADSLRESAKFWRTVDPNVNPNAPIIALQFEAIAAKNSELVGQVGNYVIAEEDGTVIADDFVCRQTAIDHIIRHPSTASRLIHQITADGLPEGHIYSVNPLPSKSNIMYTIGLHI